MTAAARPAGAVPPRAVVLCAEGARHQAAGRTAEALRSYEAAVRMAPQAVELRLILALALASAGRTADARAALHGVDVEALDFADAVRLGEARRRLGDPDGAAACYQHALTLRPGAVSLLANLGGVLHQAGRLEEARDALGRAAARQDADGADPAALINLGVVHHALGDYAAALGAFDAALARSPGQPRALRNRALVQLTLGDHAAGWAGHEHRFAVAGDGTARPAFTQPPWEGEALAGERVLLWPEQGLGDQIQFVRFARLVRERGGVPVVRASRPLVRLLASCPGVAEVVGDDEPLPAFERHAALMSLPHLLDVGGERHGGDVPYLRPVGECPAPLAAAPAGGADRRELQVGLAWAGAPGHANDRNRSLDLPALAPLLALPGVRWHSLQQGAAAAALDALAEPLRARVHALAPHCADLNDTAHAVARLDLVVTVDTSVAHLAGSLGAPAWVLLPHVPDWRWQLRRAHTPWYPTLRLFRQPARGDWAGAVHAVVAALTVLAAPRRPAGAAAPGG